MKLQSSNFKYTLSRRGRLGVWGLKFLWSFGLGVLGFANAFAASSPSLTDLKFYPPEISLTSAKSLQRWVVQATYADGITRDITTQAQCKLLNPKIARLDRFIVAPLSDGKTELRVNFKGRSLTVPVAVVPMARKTMIAMAAIGLLELMFFMLFADK